MKGEYNFYYSTKQRQIIADTDKSSSLPKIALLDTGKKVEYTCCVNVGMVSSARFDDIKYLGTGKIYSIGGIIQ